MKIKSTKLISLATGVFFFISQFYGTSVAWGAALPVSQIEVSSSHAYTIDLPEDLGSVQSIHSGSGPTLFHIQTAHGNYEAQVRIRDILNYLNKELDVQHVLVEGSAFALRPELLEFYPQDNEVNAGILDGLARAGVAKGAELFLAETPSVSVHGIENVLPYVRNASSFQSVLKQKAKTQAFLTDLEIQIKRLVSPYLNPSLRHFLVRLEDFDHHKTRMDEQITFLEVEAKRHLEIEFSNPVHQVEWPMLVRLQKLEEFEKDLDPDLFKREKKLFLNAVRHLPDDLRKQIESFLDSPVTRNQLPSPETGLLFEAMASHLPKDFPYEEFTQVNRVIGHLILQSEVDGHALFEEVDRLKDQIIGHLIKTSEEQQIVELLEQYQLLKRLFALKLTPQDYELILSQQDLLQPSRLIRQFKALNQEQRVRDVEFQEVEEIDTLYEKALDFYRGAKLRDQTMIENIQRYLGQRKIEKVAVITGGFHASPFEDYFTKKGYQYVLISPRLTTFAGYEQYVKNLLNFTQNQIPVTESTLEDAYYLSTPRSELRQLGRDPVRVATWIYKRIPHDRSLFGTSTAKIKQELNRSRYFKQFVHDGAFRSRSEVRSTQTVSSLRTREDLKLQIQTPLSIQQKKNLMPGDNITYSDSGEIRMKIDQDVSGPWTATMTSLKRIDLMFRFVLDGENLSDVIIRRAQEVPEGEKLVVVDWGAGNGRAITDLAGRIPEELRDRVQLIAFGDIYFNWWQTGLQEGVSFILDRAEKFDEYFEPGSIDIIYSHLGLNHLSGDGPHVNELAKSMGLDESDSQTVYAEYLKRKIAPLLKPDNGMLVTNAYKRDKPFANIQSSLDETFDITGHFPIPSLRTIEATNSVVRLDIKFSKARSEVRSEPIEFEFDDAGHIIQPLRTLTEFNSSNHNEVIKNILLYGIDRKIIAPKLGEEIVDLFPIVTSLRKQFPRATIHLAAYYPSMYEASHFGGKILPVSPIVMGKMLGHKQEHEERQKQFLIENSVDLILDVSLGGARFTEVTQTAFEAGEAPYLATILSPVSLVGAVTPTTNRTDKITFQTQDRKRYNVAGFPETKAIPSRQHLLPKAGVWLKTLKAYELLGLNVHKDNLDTIQLSVKESIAALEILKKWYYKNKPGGTFDPSKKIYIINTFAITHETLMNDSQWADMIVKLVNALPNAYFVFTRGGVMDTHEHHLDDILMHVAAHSEWNRAKNEVLVLDREAIYPHIIAILGIASGVVTINTGFTHLASLYDLPTADLMPYGIEHWLSPRGNAKPFVVQAINYQTLQVDRNPRLSEQVVDYFKTIDAQPEREAVRVAKGTAASPRERAIFDRALLKQKINYPTARKDLYQFLISALNKLDLSHDHDLIPEIVFVDSAAQLGIGAPRFKAKLFTHYYEGDQEKTYLMVDESAIVVDADERWVVSQDVTEKNIIHEIIGHRLARMLFDDYAEAQRQIFTKKTFKN